MLALDSVTSTISLAQFIGCTSSKHLRLLSYPYYANLILALRENRLIRQPVTLEKRVRVSLKPPKIWSVRIVGLLQRSLKSPSRKASRVRIPDAPPYMTKINVPNEWAVLANELLADLVKLKNREIFSTLDVLWIIEKQGQLQVAYRLEQDIDELYEVISNIIKYYEKHMQAISFTKTSNIQGNTGGSCSAF